MLERNNVLGVKIFGMINIAATINLLAVGGRGSHLNSSSTFQGGIIAPPVWITTI